ncbi:TPA: hypothetical protein ACH3X1_003178 [Trebouxia sp. C0004]
MTSYSRRSSPVLQCSSAEQLEHLHRHSKRNNLVVFGVPESMALNSPAALACHMQGLLFQTPTGAGLTKLLSVAAKHTAFHASKRLRAVKWLKARGYEPFFRGITLRYRDGPLIRKCARGGANKVMAAVAPAARATAPPPPRQQQAQEPRVLEAMDPSVLLHQHGISLDGLSDPNNMVAQAARAIIDDFDSMMHASGDDVAT